MSHAVQILQERLAAEIVTAVNAEAARRELQVELEQAKIVVRRALETTLEDDPQVFAGLREWVGLDTVSTT